MAEKRVSVRLAAVGGRQVRAELEGVGEAGSRGFGRLSREMEAANARLAAFSRRVRVAAAAAVADADEGGLAFRSPLSGRFYLRPSPDQPPFVKVGDTVKLGQTIALLEVMKTFNRVTYGGAGLPETAKVLEVVPANEADIDVHVPPRRHPGRFPGDDRRQEDRRPVVRTRNGQPSR